MARKPDFAAALVRPLQGQGPGQGPGGTTDRFTKAEAYLEGPPQRSLASNPLPGGPLPGGPLPGGNAPPPRAPAVAPAAVTRDTFSFPVADHARIGRLQDRLVKAGRVATKSEVLRLGLIVLDRMDPDALAEAFAQVERLKPGRKKGASA